MDDQKSPLIDSILQQAKYFLEQAGEFYPFGSIIDNENRIRPVSLYSQDEYPDSGKILMDLENVLINGIHVNRILLAAIGADAYIKGDTNTNNAQQSALEIRLYSPTSK